MPLVAADSGDGVGLYDRWRCGEKYIPGKELEFDRFPDSELKTPSFRSSAIACSMARFLDRNDLSPEEALSFYARLPFESNRNIREAIIDALAHFNLPATNKLLRDLLKGPLEPKLLPQVCSEELVEYGRHDLLPDLYALRQRLASEKDVRKQEEARELLKAVDEGIKALEELKRRDAPVAGARPTAGASP